MIAIAKSKKTTSASRFFLLAVCFFIACTSNKNEEINAITNIEDVPSVVVTDLETTVLDSGVVKYRILASELIQFDKKEPPYWDFPKGGQVIMYDNNGLVEAQIKSNYAKYMTRQKLWELKNDVQAINQNGEVLNTEQLFLDETKDRIYSDLFVKVTTDSEILTGIGFESNMSLTDYTFKKPQIIFEVEEKNMQNK